MILCLGGLLAAQSVAQPPSQSSNVSADGATFSPDERRLIEPLIQRGMPELVEELLRGRPLPLRVCVARAYVRAAAHSPSTVERDRFLDRAVDEYRLLRDMRDDRNWFRSEERRLEWAGWCVELGDVMLRSKAAAEMDRFETTSGLDADLPRLRSLLTEARRAYGEAKPVLEDLSIGLRTEEERYLLLGIADRITRLSDQRQLNASWATVYLAMSTEAAGPRGQLLAEGLAGFDAISRASRDPPRKYNALVGAGIALREGRRYAEAAAAFDRVIASTAPRAIIARAMYEKSRSLLANHEYDRAAAQIRLLESLSAPHSDADAAFYIRMAPILRAYALVLEAQSAADPIRKKRLMDQAWTAFDEAAARSTALARLADTYRTAILGKTRSLGELAPAELRMLAARRLAQSDYSGAAECLHKIVDSTPDGPTSPEDQINLGVCLFHMNRLAEALRRFQAVESARASPAIVERAVEYAFRCAELITRTSTSPADLRCLATAAEKLSKRYPRNALATQAEWIAATARQGAGDYAAAQALYESITPVSPQYWSARRNRIACLQLAFDKLPPDGHATPRPVLAREIVSSWLSLADDLERSRPPSPTTRASGNSPANPPTAGPEPDEVEEARMAAATLLVGNELHAFHEAETILERMRPTPRALALRIACYRGMGDLSAARKLLEDFLRESPPDDRGAVLGGMVAAMESQIAGLRAAGRNADADQLDRDTVPLLQELLAWTRAQPNYARQADIVRLSLARALRRAGRREEASREVEELIRAEPRNGEYVFLAAQLSEESLPPAGSPQRSVLRGRAVKLWESLLNDPTLRERAPEQYWESRYRWLAHQLEEDRPAEVLRAIESERAWYPDLGGTPWHVQFLELADRAREAAGRKTP